VWFFSDFRPRAHFALRDTARFMRFGVPVVGSNVLYHIYKNADYFLVGKFLGIEALGLYRVAFDVAMQPTDAINVVMGRVGFPVYSRLSHDRSALRATFLSNTRALMLMVTPVAAFIFFAAEDLLSILGEGRWLAAVPAVQILVLAGLIRAATVIFPQVYVAVGRPGFATLDSAVTLVVLIAAFCVGLLVFPELGVLAICYAWLFSYPLLLAWHLLLGRAAFDLASLDYVKMLGSGLASLAVLGSSLWAVDVCAEAAQLGWLALPFFAVVSVVVQSAWLRWVAKVRWSDIVPKKK
jgi:O-antigen/teichoic acid export membrane protein